jgi:uncharacterized protein
MKFNSTPTRFSYYRAILALLLIVPISSIGALFSTTISPGAVGQGIALCCGIWMLVFPIAWHRSMLSQGDYAHDRQQLRLRLGRNDGWLAGIVLGIIMFGVIFGSYWLVARNWLDIPDIRARVERMEMNIPLTVFGFGTFQTLVNSLIEEYVWRWFVYRQCQIIWSKTWAILICAGFFTLHHVVLLIAYCHDWQLIAVGSIAVFIAGVLWAGCAKIYNSLLPSYLSHLAADLALQIVSWHVLLG